MADSNQTVGSLGIVQRWKEFVTGYHARLFGAMLYTPNGESMADDTADALKVVGVAGTALLGKVGIDQTTPGTTNAVDLKTTANTALDSTNKVPVSLYGKATVAGDVPLVATAAGGLKTWPHTAGVGLGDGNSNSAQQITNTDSNFVAANVYPYEFNGATWDRQRNNHEVTALVSAARTASVNSADLVSYNARGVVVVIDVTASADTPSIVVTISGKDTLSGKYVAILASAAITGAGTTRLAVYPGNSAAANAKADLPLPRLWRVEVVAADGDEITYSVGANYIN